MFEVLGTNLVHCAKQLVGHEAFDTTVSNPVSLVLLRSQSLLEPVVLANDSWILRVEDLVAVAIDNEELLATSSPIAMVPVNRPWTLSYGL